MTTKYQCQRTLVVDLDGTLINGDVFKERLLKVLLSNPLKLIHIFIINCFNIAKIKNELAKIVPVKPELFAYNQEIIDLIEAYRRKQQDVILASACDLSTVNQISRYLGIFSKNLGSKGNLNLKGKEKLISIKNELNQKDFDYVGNSTADEIIFQDSIQPYLTTKSLYFASKFEKKIPKILNINNKYTSIWKSIYRQARVRQWVKNTLIFFPALFPVFVLNTSSLFNLFVFFSLFCVLASATYLINDIKDIESDRVHSKKRFRPIVSGEIDILYAFVMSVLLQLIILILAGLIFGLVGSTLIFIYLCLSYAYTFIVKKVAIFDVFFLSCFYVYRLIAGCFIIGTSVSLWAVLFCFLTFFSLACLKRVIEIDKELDNNKQIITKVYQSKHRNLLTECATGSSFGAGLFFALYSINTLADLSEAKHLAVAALSVIIILFLVKLRFEVDNGQVDHDPIEYIFQKLWTVSIGLVSIIIMIFLWS